MFDFEKILYNNFMIYLLDKFDASIFQFPRNTDDYVFCFRLASNDYLKRKIQFNRTRTIFEKKEILNLFNLDSKLQITNIKEKIKLKPFDIVVVRVKDASQPFFVFDFVPVKNLLRVVKRLKIPLDK